MGSRCSLRATTLKPGALQHFQTLDRAKLPTGIRPIPSFAGANKVELDWFNNSSDEMENAQAKDVLGFLWLHNQGEQWSIPGWRSLNEATSSVDSPVTIAEMLPILQASADHNDTLQS